MTRVGVHGIALSVSPTEKLRCIDYLQVDVDLQRMFLQTVGRNIPIIGARITARKIFDMA